MALVLDDTIAGENSNSYCDATFADDYFDVHFLTTKRDAWSALIDEQKEAALIQSCLIIEQFKYTVATNQPARLSDLKWDSRTQKFTAYVTPYDDAVKYLDYQRLQFPRNLDVDTSGTLFIPNEVKIAQCEQAVYLLTFDDDPISKRLSGITLDRVTIGDIQATQEYTLAGTALAPMSYNLLRRFMLTFKRVQRA